MRLDSALNILAASATMEMIHEDEKAFLAASSPLHRPKATSKPELSRKIGIICSCLIDLMPRPWRRDESLGAFH